MDNKVEEDRERDGPTSSSTTWRTCGSRWWTQRIVPNGEGELTWLTPHQRDSQLEGEGEHKKRLASIIAVKCGYGTQYKEWK